MAWPALIKLILGAASKGAAAGGAGAAGAGSAASAASGAGTAVGIGSKAMTGLSTGGTAAGAAEAAIKAGIQNSPIPTIETAQASGATVPAPAGVQASSSLDRFMAGSKDPSFSGMRDAWKNKDYANLTGQVYGMTKGLPPGQAPQMSPLPQLPPGEPLNPFAQVYMQYGPYGRYGR